MPCESTWDASRRSRTSRSSRWPFLFISCSVVRGTEVASPAARCMSASSCSSTDCSGVRKSCATSAMKSWRRCWSCFSAVMSWKITTAPSFTPDSERTGAALPPRA